MSKNPLGFPILKMAIRFENDIVTARQKARRICQLLGFDSQDQARLATGVSELARNVYQYAGTGTVEFFFADNERQTFFMKVSDQGPGITHIDDIFNGIYVSKSGMGVGLLGTKKLMDTFDIESTPGQGTTITVGKYLDRRAKAITKNDLNKLSETLVARHAENPFEEIQNQNRDLLNALEDIRATKEELNTLNSELAETNRGVVALYAELDEKAASLQRANEVKSKFLSNMTHEFRTPLSSVISLTRILLDRIDGELTIEQEKQVNYIRKASEGLLDLVNDLLDLAKVEAGKISINAAEFRIEEILSSIRGVFRPLLLENRDIELVVEGGSYDFDLVTDQAKVSQIIRNLVSNAIKFTERGKITVSYDIDPLDRVHFKVTDTGVGISASHLETIFEDFSQIDSGLQRKQKGTGLGLPLSRKLARLLGGDVWAESQPGEGSIFHVIIPRRYSGNEERILFTHTDEPKADVRRVLDQPVDVSSQFRVLLIDDDEASRYILKNLISREIDATFLEANDGRLGLEKINSWHPDVVFLDLTMPHRDGFDVLREIRLSPRLRDLAVVVNTAKKLSFEEKEFLEKEATAVLSKERSNDKQAQADLQTALNKAGFDYKARV